VGIVEYNIAKGIYIAFGNKIRLRCLLFSCHNILKLCPHLSEQHIKWRYPFVSKGVVWQSVTWCLWTLRSCCCFFRKLRDSSANLDGHILDLLYSLHGPWC